MSDEFKRPAILEELDNFNTAPIEEAGSIMEGIMNEQQGAQPVQQTLASEETPEAEKKETIDPYLPLNTSIQELGNEFRDTFTGLRREVSELRNNYQPQQQSQPQQAAQPQYNYDPEAPVTMAHLQQLVQGYTTINTSAQEALKNSAKARGLMEFMHFKQENPGFAMDPNVVDSAVDKAFQNGQSYLVSNPSNWRGFFEMSYAPQRVNLMADKDKRIADLEKQLESHKKRPPVTTTTPVSPAVGRTTSRPTTIESPTSEPNDDILQMKSFQRKGDFKRFGNDLKRKLNMAK